MHLRSILIADGDPLDGSSGGGGGGGGADRHPDFPMLPADTRTDRDGNPIYHAAMRLPRPTDRRAVCEFLGLADAMCASVVAHAAAAGHGGAASSSSSAEGVVQLLVESYLARGRPGGPALPPRHGSQDDPETHQGLLPRFASSIGGRVEMVPSWASHTVDSSLSSSSSSSNGGLVSPPPHRYFSIRTSAREDADAIVRRNAEVLRHLWGQQQQQQQQQQQLAAEQS